MARLFTWGFEIGVSDPNEFADGTSGFTATARTGNKAAYFAYNGDYIRKTLASALTELSIRGGVYPRAPHPGADQVLCYFANADGENMAAVLCEATTDKLKACRWEGGAWTVLATSVQALTLDTYQCVEAHLHLDNAGDLDIRVDGVDWITFPGDTLGDQTPASIKIVAWGRDVTGGGNARIMYLDDLAINDTAGALNNSWCGRGGVYPLAPSADGDNIGLVPSAGANWQCVDEAPPNTTDWVSDSVVDDYDLYQTVDPTPDAGTVINLRMFATAKLSEAGAGSGALMMKTNAAEYTGTDTALDTTWRWLTKLEYQLNPATGVRFTLAEIQALQIGVKVR